MKQTTYLAMETEDRAYACGYLAYNDESAQRDASQQYHPFVQMISTDTLL